MAKKKKYYVVWEGYQSGIYDNWTDCQLQIKGYPNARYKSFSSLAEAEAGFSESAPKSVTKKKKAKRIQPHMTNESIICESISVDAACSGNPGDMEYRGVRTCTGEELFRVGPYPDGTNNVGEFLALVHVLALIKRNGWPECPIYSDSITAMAWLRNAKANTKLNQTRRNRPIFDLIGRAESWVKKNTYGSQILKWNTKEWGEIPADFGRK